MKKIISGLQYQNKNPHQEGTWVSKRAMNSSSVDGKPLLADVTLFLVDGTALPVAGTVLPVAGTVLLVDGTSLLVDGMPLPAHVPPLPADDGELVPTA